MATRVMHRALSRCYSKRLLLCTLVSLVTLSSQGTNEDIVREFNHDQRPLLAIGLTPNQTIVIFGARKYHKERDYYVYQMSKASFTPGAQHMVSLTKGGLVSTMWPAFFEALRSKKNQAVKHMVILHDHESEYVLALFGQKTHPVLYDLRKHQVKAHFSLSNVSVANASVIFSGWQPLSFYGLTEVDALNYFHVYQSYHLSGTKANSNIHSASLRVCFEKNARNWMTIKQAVELNCKSQHPGWHFSTGFANATHFHLIGRQQVAIFKIVFDSKGTSQAITFLKRRDFFSVEAIQNRLFLSVGILIGAVSGGLLVVSCIAMFCLRSRPPTAKHKVSSRSARSRNQTGKQGRQTKSSKKGQRTPTSQKRSPTVGRPHSASLRQSLKKKSPGRPGSSSVRGKSKASPSKSKRRRTRSKALRKHSRSVASPAKSSAAKRQTTRRLRTRPVQCSLRLSKPKPESRRRPQKELTSFATARSSVIETKLKRLPTLVTLEKMDSKTAIHRGL